VAEEFDDIQLASLVTLNRIYDVLMCLLVDADPDAAAVVVDIHKSGRFMAPPPSIVVTDE
jgi:hypothetical protein